MIDPGPARDEAAGADANRASDSERAADGSGIVPGPEYGETWVYESIIGALPGIDISERLALVIQFTLFEVGVLVLAAVYGQIGRASCRERV